MTAVGPRTDRSAGVTVSVVIPSRNECHVLGQQLEALFQEAVSVPWEVIVVDDGSTDSTGELLSAWQGRHPHLGVVRTGKGGSPSAARNAGLRVASGELVLFCDADDIVQSGWIEALVHGLGEHDLVGGPLGFDSLNPRAPSAMRCRPLDEHLPLSADHLPFVHTGNLGVRRHLAVALGGFDESMATSEDQDFSWRAIRAGLSIGFVPEAVVQVRLPHTLRGLWRQRLSWGIGSVDLYVRHRHHMPPPRSPRAVVAEALRLLATLPLAAVSPMRRFHVVASGAFLVGRVRGSLRHRTMYL